MRELYARQVQLAKQNFAEKKYKEACENANNFIDIDPVAKEDRLFAGRVFLKGAYFKQAYSALRGFVGRRATEEAKLLYKVAGEIRNFETADEAIGYIFQKALQGFMDGNLGCTEALSELDLLLNTEAHICFLRAKSTFLQGKPRDAFSLLQENFESVSHIELKAKYEKLMKECEESIMKNANELELEEAVVKDTKVIMLKGKEVRSSRDSEVSQHREATEDEEATTCEREEQVEEQVPLEENFLDVSSLPSKIFDIDLKCQILEMKGGLPFGNWNLDKLTTPISLVDFGDSDAAQEALNLMMSIEHKSIMRGMATFCDKYVIVPESKTLLYWVSKKKEHFLANPSSSPTKNNWWKFIKKDLRVILRDAGRALTVLLDKKLGCARMNLDDCGVLICNNRVKIIPSKPIGRLTSIENLRNLMCLIIGFPFDLTAEDVIHDPEFALCAEFLSFHRLINKENLAFVGHSTLLDPPFVWDSFERYMFIEKMTDLIHREIIPLNHVLEIIGTYVKFNPSSPLICWKDKIPTGSIFMAILNYATVEEGGTSSGTVSPSYGCYSIVRFCFNVYRHFSENRYQHYPERQKGISKVKIEKLIRKMFPWMYFSIFEALLIDLHYVNGKWPKISRDEAFRVLLSYSPLAKDAEMILEDVDGFIIQKMR